MNQTAWENVRHSMAIREVSVKQGTERIFIDALRFLCDYDLALPLGEPRAAPDTLPFGACFWQLRKILV